MIAKWHALVEEGVAACGAFAGDRLVGIAFVRFGLTDEMSQLAELYVDRGHRRMGVGGALVDEVEAAAKATGAHRLSVSATPSDSAVPFYLGRGFAPVAEPHPELFALEPEDIHMAKSLRR